MSPDTRRYSKAAVRRRVSTTVLMAALIAAALAWGDDYESCTRQQDIRSALTASAGYYEKAAARAGARALLDHGRVAALDRQARQQDLAIIRRLRVRRLSCLQLIPDD